MQQTMELPIVARVPGHLMEMSLGQPDGTKRNTAVGTRRNSALDPPQVMPL